MGIQIPWRLGELLPVTWSIRSSIRKLGVVDLPANPDFTQRTQFEASIRAQHPSLREGQVHAVMGWEWPDVPPVPPENLNVLVPEGGANTIVGYDGMKGIGSLTPDFIIPHDRFIITSLFAENLSIGAYVRITLKAPSADIKSIVIDDLNGTSLSLWYNTSWQNYQSRPEDANIAYLFHREWIFNLGKPHNITLEIVPPITTGAT